MEFILKQFCGVYIILPFIQEEGIFVHFVVDVLASFYIKNELVGLRRWFIWVKCLLFKYEDLAPL